MYIGCNVSSDKRLEDFLSIKFSKEKVILKMCLKRILSICYTSLQMNACHTVQEVYKVASKNNACTQFWSQHSSVRSTHSLPAKDVDGSLVTRASQDHFVGFHHLTILRDQGDIKEILVK